MDMPEGQSPTDLQPRVISWLNRFRKDSRNVPSTALEQQIQHNLQGKNIAPHQTNYSGLPAALETTDNASEDFFKEIKSLNPDGYIVGIGSGSILTILKAFTKRRQPKGLIMVDINPYVVTAGKVLIEVLQNSTNPADVLTSLYSPGAYGSHADKVLQEDPQLKKATKRWRVEQPRYYMPNIPDFSRFRPSPIHTDVPTAIFQNFEILQQMAKDGRMASVYADFSNPDLTKAVTALPGFRESTNVIFTSNALDLQTKVNEPHEMGTFVNLKDYDNPGKDSVFVTCPQVKGLEMEFTRSYDDLEELYQHYYVQENLL